MAYNFDPQRPIYLQLIDLIRQGIAAGQWVPGGKIPTVRDLALMYGVNPNTVQRALSELERDGLLFCERTSGRFITQDASRIVDLRRQLADDLIEHLAEQLLALGYEPDQLLKLIGEKWSERYGHH